MSGLKFKKMCFGLVCCVAGMFAIPAVQATIVEFRMQDGSSFRVNLFDKETPKTVANFLGYVNDTHDPIPAPITGDPDRTIPVGNYANTIFHRRVEKSDFKRDSDGKAILENGERVEIKVPFVAQGGGYTYLGAGTILETITTAGTVDNEPKFSNLRGTVAMAKGDSPNSATSQWFFNLSDNHGSVEGMVGSVGLDSLNGGFTVFGKVTTGFDKLGAAVDGMDIVDLVGKDNTVLNFDPKFETVPVQNYTQADLDAGVMPTDSHFFTVQSIVVIDDTADTMSSLDPQPARNTIIEEINNSNNGGGGGGSLGFLGLFVLSLLRAMRRRV